MLCEEALDGVAAHFGEGGDIRVEHRGGGNIPGQVQSVLSVGDACAVACGAEGKPVLQGVVEDQRPAVIQNGVMAPVGIEEIYVVARASAQVVIAQITVGACPTATCLCGRLQSVTHGCALRALAVSRLKRP